MIRRTAALLTCALWSPAAQAQEQSIPVYFEPLNGGEFAPLNKAIQDAFSQPPLHLDSKAGPHTLVVSVPDKVDVERKKISGTFYAFTVSFARDGRSLGRSEQSCSAAKLSDCTDQLVLDVKSASEPR